MHTHIIGLDGDLRDILEDCIDIPVNGVGMVSKRKLSRQLKKRSIENIIELQAYWLMLYLI